MILAVGNNFGTGGFVVQAVLVDVVDSVDSLKGVIIHSVHSDVAAASALAHPVDDDQRGLALTVGIIAVGSAVRPRASSHLAQQIVDRVTGSSILPHQSASADISRGDIEIIARFDCNVSRQFLLFEYFLRGILQELTG